MHRDLYVFCVYFVLAAHLGSAWMHLKYPVVYFISVAISAALYKKKFFPCKKPVYLF